MLSPLCETTLSLSESVLQLQLLVKMSEVEVDSRALLPEDVTESADMNLRKQIYRVVMRYIELPPKGL